MIPLANNLAIRRREGELGFNSEKESIIVVTHEASRTGAPILALNICQELHHKYNIITLVLRSGQLDNEFKKVSSAVLNLPYRVITRGSVIKTLNKMKIAKKPKYAIVNSIVSARCIQPLRASGIPVITLIHEFSAYIRPKSLRSQDGRTQ